MFPTEKRLTLEQQKYRMHLAWPSFEVRRYRRQVEILWVGALQPTALSETYTVSILLRPGWCPEARVLQPHLKTREGTERLPHVNGDGSLCLHVDGEWSSTMFVADTTVPWITVWLYFYEVWHAIGSWVGGGTHPDRPEHRCA
jgi:hypothetical protein